MAHAINHDRGARKLGLTVNAGAPGKVFSMAAGAVRRGWFSERENI